MAENYITTGLKKLRELFISDKRFLVAQGGMRSAKTYSILMLVISWCQTNRDRIATVASMSYPHLSRGVIRDFQTIMKAAEGWEPERWNSSSKVYTFPNGTMLEFISVDNMSAHGPARNLLFVNEANDMSQDTFEQLAARTTDKVIIDYNPTREFWAHTWLLKEYKEDSDFIILTYLDNEALAPSIREYIESKAPKQGEKPSNWFTVYGLGQIGVLEGNIYSGWIEDSAENVQKGAQLVRYGLDFGFGHPTGLVGLYEREDGSYGVTEELYRAGMKPSDYVPALKAIGIDPTVLIVADSARPEIIAEIKKAGYRIIGANKDAGSVERGILRVQEKQIHFTGKNLKAEYLAYHWRTKRSTGETIYEPEKSDDDLMDALRYAIDDLSKPRFDF